MTETDRVVGVRLEPNGPVVFCHATVADLELGRGQRVMVAWADGVREEAVVAIAPGQIVAAPPLDGAPRVVGVVPATPPEATETVGDEMPGIVFLPATEGGVDQDDLRRALRLAALPLPDAPPERR